MAYLGTSPDQETVLRLEARKSFSLNFYVRDYNGRPLDITTAKLRLVMKALPLNPNDVNDDDNLIVNSSAVIVDGPTGHARFNVQASELNHPIGAYPYVIVMSVGGFSAVMVKGTADLQPNTEFTSIGESYADEHAAQGLEVRLRGANVVSLRTGPTLAPGTTSFTDEDKRKLDTIEEGAQQHIVPDWAADHEQPGYIANKPVLGSAAYADINDIGIPDGGSPGEVLVKLSAAPRHVGWAQPSGGGGGGAGLDPTGVPASHVPMANGADGWSWQLVTVPVTSVNGQTGDIVLDLGSINDTAGRLALTPAERSKIDAVKVRPDWSDLDSVPAFGSAALAETTDFLAPGAVDAATDVTSGELDIARVPRMSTLRGFTYGTSAPIGGEPGDLYFQYV